ncbi:uncharacterized protein LOC142235473 [Haematobia irritans]|uniref:uncharacterized protein LOC142235473 n=1 Tax=Haematobia irritans TaxID=7368 RepID=UPI003F4F672B
MNECKPVSTPFDLNVKLTKSRSDLKCSDNIPYQEAIGCLLYLFQETRPDLAYAVNYLNKFNNNFDNSHWTSVKRIFRYLKGTIDTKITYKKNADFEICGYCDADYLEDRAQGMCLFIKVLLAETTSDMAMAAAVPEAEW